MAIARKNNNPDVKKELQSYGMRCKGIFNLFMLLIFCSTIENGIKLLKEATDGNESELKKILDGGDVDVEFTKPDKNTVVHICAAYGYINCLQLLVAKVFLFVFVLLRVLMFLSRRVILPAEPIWKNSCPFIWQRKGDTQHVCKN